jgi:hypothetical protein
MATAGRIPKPIKGNLFYQASLLDLKKFVLHALSGISVNRNIVALKLYDLVEIYLGNTDIDRTTLDTFDLLIIFLSKESGMENRQKIPLFLKAISDRAYVGKPTWVMSEGTVGEISRNYGSTLADALELFKRINK